MKAGKPGDNDDDLADLLPAGSKDAGGNYGKQQQSPQAKKFQPFGGICGLISAHLSYLCFAYPSACGCFACVLCLIVVSFLVINLVNPNQNFGVVKHDWATVNSAYDLDIAKVDHWCLGGGNEGCRCEDPMVPASRVELRSWTEAFKDNKQQIEKFMDDPLDMAELDVAIIGESAVEEMDGRWMGRRPNDQLKSIGSIFKSHFKKDKGAQVEGVALGIAGDSANNVLWRLLHGEMPDGFEPKIWWVQIGMNDLTRQQCSEEVVVLGVLRIVEEIIKRRPKARIVINSLLPMADLRGGTVVTEQDYKDAFSTYRGKRKSGTATAHYVRKKTEDGREIIVPNSRKPKPDDRRRLEEALEAYSARTNDNSDYIDFLQSKLSNSTLDNEDDMMDDYHTNSMHRRLDDAEVPKYAKRDKYNPKLDREKHNQKKYQFFRQRRMPLWTSIYSINKQLFKFCEKHEKVDFFDATNVFAERKSDGSQRFFTLMSDLISARGHPTELGYAKWEDAMVKKITYILGEMKRTNPELFLTAPPPVENPFGTIGGRTGETRGGPDEVDRLEKKSLDDENRGEDVDEDEEESDKEDEEEEGNDDEESDKEVKTTPAGGFQPQPKQQYSGMQPGMPQNPQQQQYSGTPPQQMNGVPMQQGSYPRQGAGGVPGGVPQPQNPQMSGGALQQQPQQQYSPIQPGMPQNPQQQQYGTVPQQTSGVPMQQGSYQMPANGVAPGGITQPQPPRPIGGLPQGVATRRPGTPVKKVKKKKTAPPVVEPEEDEEEDDAAEVATRRPVTPAKKKVKKKKKTAPPVVEPEEDEEAETDEEGEDEAADEEEADADEETDEEGGDEAEGDEADADTEAGEDEDADAATDETDEDAGGDADADTEAGEDEDADAATDETDAGEEESEAADNTEDEGDDDAAR